MNRDELIKRLDDAITELDYDKASWIHKHVVIDTKDKCKLLVKSLITLEGADLTEVITATNELLTDVEPFIKLLNDGKV